MTTKVAPKNAVKADQKNASKAVEKQSKIEKQPERKRPSVFPGARQRDKNEMTSKGRVYGAWKAAPNATAEEIQTISKHPNLNTVQSWLGMFRKGYGFPVLMGDATLLPAGLTPAQREAISHGMKVDNVPVAPPVVNAIKGSKLTQSPNKECVAPVAKVVKKTTTKETAVKATK